MHTKTLSKKVGSRFTLAVYLLAAIIIPTIPLLPQPALAATSSGTWQATASEQCRKPGDTNTATADLVYTNAGGKSTTFHCFTITNTPTTHTMLLTSDSNDACGQPQVIQVSAKTSPNYHTDTVATWYGNCGATADNNFSLFNSYDNAAGSGLSTAGTATWTATKPVARLSATFKIGTTTKTETFTQSNLTGTYLTLKSDSTPAKNCPASYVVVGDRNNSYTDVTVANLVEYTAAGSSCTAQGGNLNLDESFQQADNNNSLGSPTSNDDGCPIGSGDALRWIMCPLFTAGMTAIRGLNSVISNFLYVPTDQIFGTPQTANKTTASFQNAFNVFRNLGISLLIISGLVMVLSQAADLEIFSAHTVKSALPRIVIAAIGMAIAWPLLQFVVTFFNDLGTWVGSIILTATQVVPNGGATNFGDVGNAISGIFGAIAALTVVVAVMGSEALMALVGTILLATFVGFIVLAIRQLVILLCILLAPLAIAAAVMPGTEKLWKFWRDAFIGALLMFPIIMGFLAAGVAMGSIAAAAGSNAAAGTAQLSWDLIAIIVTFAPYFMLPFAFRLASGIMGAVVNAVTGAHGGLFKTLAERRQEQGALHRERTIGRQVLNARSRGASGLQRFASRSGPLHFARRPLGNLLSGMVGGYNVQQQMSARTAAVSKEMNDQIATGDDSEIRALTVNKRTSAKRVQNGIIQYQSLGGAWVSEGAVDRAYSRWGRDTFAQQGALSYEMRKAAGEDEVQGIANNFNKVAKGWGMSDERRSHAWLGAAFENQNSHLEFKKMTGANGAGGKWEGPMRLDESGSNAFVKEVYEKRGSYNMAQMSSNTIRELQDVYARTTDQDTREMIQGIAQTFMHDFGGGVAGMQGDEPQNMPGSSRRQAGTPGAAHVAERVRELADMTGVLRDAPIGDYSDPNHTPSPNNPRRQT